MNEPVELKPCPFCGGVAAMRSFYDYDAIQCDNCGQVVVLPQHGCGNEHIAAWNLRTPLEADNKVLTMEELRGMGGEPVYILSMEEWVLVSMRTGAPCFIFRDNGKVLASDCYEACCTAYRHPPEKGE